MTLPNADIQRLCQRATILDEQDPEWVPGLWRTLQEGGALTDEQCVMLAYMMASPNGWLVAAAVLLDRTPPTWDVMKMPRTAGDPVESLFAWMAEDVPDDIQDRCRRFTEVNKNFLDRVTNIGEGEWEKDFLIGAVLGPVLLIEWARGHETCAASYVALGMGLTLARMPAQVVASLLMSGREGVWVR